MGPSTRSDALDFLDRLIRTESLPGNEGAIAQVVAKEMERLGYDSVRIDAAGNVIGTVTGTGAAAPVLFNTHLDHVDVGDPAAWPSPPFEPTLKDGELWGRGAVDIKGPLAAQVYGVASLLTSRPPGDVHVTCVVQEEIGGVGARYLATTLPVERVVVGEPSRNTVRRGHRGRCEIEVHCRGRSVHASVPHEGINPLFTLAHLLTQLHRLDLPDHPDLGACTVVPTLLRTDQTSANVVPGEVWQLLDCRLVPAQEPSGLCDALRELASSAPDQQAEVEVAIPTAECSSYTGFSLEMPADNPAYLVDEDHPLIRAACDVVQSVTGTDSVDVWQFATDGGHFAEAGATPVGFGPGDELLAHTVDERIPLDQFEQALEINAKLAVGLGQTAMG